jgi:hypothetical protein
MACFSGVWGYSSSFAVSYMAYFSPLLCGCNYLAYYNSPQRFHTFGHPLLLHQRYDQSFMVPSTLLVFN